MRAPASTPETLPAIDRAVDRRVSTGPTTGRTTRSWSWSATSRRTRCSRPRSRRLAAGRGAPCPTPSRGAAGAEGPHAGVRAAAQQRAVVDLGRQLHAGAQRSAVVHAAAGQPDLRRRVRLAAGPEHPRREGLHLLAAVDFPGDGAGRPVSRGGRRAQRRHRRDAQGDLRRDRQAPRRRARSRGAERRQAVLARPVRAAERHADRPGQHAQHREHASGCRRIIPKRSSARSRSRRPKRSRPARRCCSARRTRWS